MSEVRESVLRKVAGALGALGRYVASHPELECQDMVTITVEVKDKADERHVIKTVVVRSTLDAFEPTIDSYEVRALRTPGRKKGGR